MDPITIKKLQDTQIEILEEIIKICNEYNLDYFLIGGTLLGAVRHEGFIPWDDDLDIAMPRTDYEKLLILCQTKLNPKYYLHSHQTDEEYWLPFAKIKKNGTVFEEQSITNISTHKGIFIDIFPLDNANNQKSFFQDIQANIVKKLSALILYKRGINLSDAGILVKIILSIFKLFKLKTLVVFQEKIMSYNKNDNSEYFINLGSNYNYIKQTIPKEKFYPLQKLKFEKKLYHAPKDWDYILRRIFDDYMLLPPKNQRVTHNPVEIKFTSNEIDLN